MSQREAAKQFISEAVRLLSEGRKEQILIRNLVANLPNMFPENLSWVNHHVRNAEAQVGYLLEGQERRAFIDSLVGSTTVEYEHDLTSRPIFSAGLGQVHQHVAGLLNAGIAREQIVGVLSDTIRWRAYRVRQVGPGSASGRVGPKDVELEEVANLDVSGGSDLDADRLIDFLMKYLGREGSRPLNADTIAYDLGFESDFHARHLTSLDALVEDSLKERPEYANVIKRLWADFVGYLGDTGGTGTFDVTVYISELYVVTLAKLLCANVIARQGLHSDDSELESILNGAHFKAKGLENLVEYDYFGWLNDRPNVTALIPIASEMQRDLRAYDFESPAPEDLFGQVLAQLARRSQRVLLGQERTPTWLAALVARQLLAQLGPDQKPRFIDMCCGSGSMLVEVVKLAKEHLAAKGPIDAAAVAELSQVATGFDIDPLAVMLAKVNWVVASRDWLDPFDGSRRLSIPVYLADSMFAKTPLGEGGDRTKTGTFELSLQDHPVDLPAFLVSPGFRSLFDALLDRGYSLGMAAASVPKTGPIDESDLSSAIDEACSESNTELDDTERVATSRFVRQLVEALEDLNRKGLNGIWAFVIRNSYRPGLVVGQFNGLISNPPWLALSKLANNPYTGVLRTRAEAYAVKPPGASHLHMELATTFLLHAVDHYLRNGAVVGCVLPETILNGYQHTPFRRGAYRNAPKPVKLGITELWRVESGTFKNEAVVLFGTKADAGATERYPGQLVSRTVSVSTQFKVVKLGDRVAWSDSDGAVAGGWFDDISLRQGADIMPRTTVFHDVKSAGAGRSRIAPIDTSNSPLAYLVKESKRMRSFQITPTVIPDRYLFDVLLSKHLVPFDIGNPAKAFLPIERGQSGAWVPASTTKLAASPTAKAAFDEILRGVSAEVGKAVDLDYYFHSIDSDRKKLTGQKFPKVGFLVLQGAGGTYSCASYANLDRFDPDRLILDQTLYWTVVDSEDEAIYISGLFNSDALDSLIADFQPQGQFGRRHVHELPPKVTPGYNPSEAIHAAVVTTTRNLLAEYAEVRKDPMVAKYFDPAGHLPSRRGILRRKVIPSLASFAEYDSACKELYGITG